MSKQTERLVMLSEAIQTGHTDPTRDRAELIAKALRIL
jgi:hypothetical protein